MKYTVAGAQPAYDAQPGDEVNLDPADAGVSLNVDAGVLVPVAGQVLKMTCPACVEQGVKRPVKFGSPDELAEHYGEKHPALVAPDWKED